MNNNMESTEAGATSNEREDFAKADARLDEIKGMNMGDMSDDDLENVMAERKALRAQKEEIVGAAQVEAAAEGQERSDAEKVAAETARIEAEATAQAEKEKQIEERKKSDAVQAEALTAEIKGVSVEKNANVIDLSKADAYESRRSYLALKREDYLKRINDWSKSVEEYGNPDSNDIGYSRKEDLTQDILAERYKVFIVENLLSSDRIDLDTIIAKIKMDHSLAEGFNEKIFKEEAFSAIETHVNRDRVKIEKALGDHYSEMEKIKGYTKELAKEILSGFPLHHTGEITHVNLWENEGDAKKLKTAIEFFEKHGGRSIDGISVAVKVKRTSGEIEDDWFLNNFNKEQNGFIVTKKGENGVSLVKIVSKGDLAVENYV